MMQTQIPIKIRSYGEGWFYIDADEMTDIITFHNHCTIVLLIKIKPSQYKLYLWI